MTPDGRIEHRLQFHVSHGPDVWFAVRAGALRYEVVLRPGRELPALTDRFPDGPVTDYGRLQT